MPILTPGFLKWDGLKFILDPEHVAGGAVGPTIVNSDIGVLPNIDSDEDGIPAFMIIFSGSSSMSLTGVKGGTESREIKIFNTNSGSTLTVKHLDGTSVSENQIICPGGVDFTLSYQESTSLIYSATELKWRVTEQSTTITNIGGLNTQLLFNNAGAVDGVSSWTNQSAGRINSDGGYITLGSVGATYSSAGDLRISMTTGIHNVISARDTTYNTNYNLVRYLPRATYFGGAGNFVNLVGNRVNISTSVSLGDPSDPPITSVGHIQISGGATGTDFSGAYSPGGVLINYPVGIGFSAPLGLNFNGAVCAFNWVGDADDGNANSVPTTPPNGSHAVQWVNEPGRFVQYFRGNEKFKTGGSYPTAGADGYKYTTTTRYSPNFWPKFGPAREEFIGRTRWFYHRRLFYEHQKAAGGPNPFHIVRFDMTDEVYCSFYFKVVKTRRTSTVSAGTYEGRANYRRTAGGAPTIVGAAVYETEQEVTAGDGVAFAVSGNEVWVYVTAADNNELANYGCVLEVMEIYPD